MLNTAEALRWRKSWRTAVRKVWSETCHALPPSAARREPFQLLAAALIYHTNGVLAMSNNHLHSGAVPTIPWDGDQYRHLFDATTTPLFTTRCRSPRTLEYYGNMHLASASLRVPSALYLLGQSRESVFSRFVDTKDVKRPVLVEALSSFGSLGCHPFPSSLDDGDLGVQVAIVVAHRDRIGHGAGSPLSGDWPRRREPAFSLLTNCQLVEAQLCLIHLGLADLRV